MAQEWFIDGGDGVEGPLTTRDLRGRAATGRLRPGDRVSPDRVKWVRAERVKGLTFAAAAATKYLAGLLETQVLPPAAAHTPLPSDALEDTVVVPVEHIPGYDVQGVLGRGACGIVFRARQQKLDRVVALKTVIVDGPNARTAVSRFELEAVALAKLAHPHIVTVYDSGHHEGRVYFAMELLDGEDLSRRMDRGPLDERTAWSVARQTAAALSHAAGLGVYHRDIKPANLFLVAPPTGFVLPAGVPMVKVTDFGLALTKRAADVDTDSRLTAAGVVLGTPAYMAPEQFASSDIDHRADIYALGATVFHALAGAPPFDGANVWEVMLKKMEAAPRLGPPVSDESAALVAAMLAEKPADRVGSYEELIARIDELPCVRASAAPSGAVAYASVRVPATAGARRRKTRLYVAAAAGGLAIAGLFAAFGPGLGGGSPDPAGHGAAKDAGPATYVSSGFSDALFDGDVRPWIGPGVGVADHDGNPVVTCPGSLRRPLPQPLRPHYRVQFGLNLHEATAVDVIAAVGEGPPETATRWVLRITRTRGTQFGRMDGGERGKFEPLGDPVPFPTAAELERSVPYQGVMIEKAGDKIRVAYRDRTAGVIDNDGRVRVAEIRLLIEGGAVRVESPTVEELREK